MKERPLGVRPRSRPRRPCHARRALASAGPGLILGYVPVLAPGLLQQLHGLRVNVRYELLLNWDGK